MTALPDAPNVIRLTHQWKSSTDTDVICRLFFRFAGTGPTNAQVNTWLGAVHGEYVTNMISLAHADVVLTALFGADLTSSTGGASAIPFSDAGTRAGTALPAGTSVLINNHIQRRYRGGKPRTYWPGGTAGDVLDGQDWSVAFLNAFGAGWNAYINAITTTPLGTANIQTQCSVSYYSGVNDPITLPSGRVKQSSKVRPAAVVDDITSHQINGRYGSQRRRNRP